MNIDLGHAVARVQVPTDEAHLRAKAALYRATERFELIWRKVVQSEIARRQRHNRKLLPRLLPWLRRAVDTRAVHAEVERAMLDQPDRAARVKWWMEQSLQKSRARVAQTILAHAHTARTLGETHISVPRGEWAWLDPSLRGETATNHDETRMLLHRKL